MAYGISAGGQGDPLGAERTRILEATPGLGLRYRAAFALVFNTVFYSIALFSIDLDRSDPRDH